MHQDRGLISIWFFIGILLFAYGILILAGAFYELAVPPERPVVLANLHAGVWWGAFVLAMGVFYTYWFNPKRGR
jgi:hypothetical protein